MLSNSYTWFPGDNMIYHPVIVLADVIGGKVSPTTTLPEGAVIIPEEEVVIALTEMDTVALAKAYRASYITYQNFLTLEWSGVVKPNLNLDDLSDVEYVMGVVEGVAGKAVTLSLIHSKFVAYAPIGAGFAVAVWPGRRFPGALFLDVEGEDGGEFSDFITLLDPDIRVIASKLRRPALKALRASSDRQYLIIVLDKTPDGGRDIVGASIVPIDEEDNLNKAIMNILANKLTQPA